MQNLLRKGKGKEENHEKRAGTMLKGDLNKIRMKTGRQWSQTVGKGERLYWTPRSTKGNVVLDEKENKRRRRITLGFTLQTGQHGRLLIQNSFKCLNVKSGTALVLILPSIFSLGPTSLLLSRYQELFPWR
jgi:hypothetical protein